MHRFIGPVLVLLTALPCVGRAIEPLPSVVFLLLDTTRADRMSAWGNPRPTTPHLDRLATRGIRFARHFANSHATRPSMPQLMTGRYYQQSILRDFRSDEHPREYPFAVRDPTEVLLPHAMRESGYRAVGVSAHPWVSPDSRFGVPFDRFDLLDSPLERGHADAGAIVDRALHHWEGRDPERPLFLYLHFMDPHIPRSLPDGRLRFTSGVDQSVASRFDAAGEPVFGAKRRGWDRSDARDFSPADRDYFVAVYDTLLAYMDEEVGRFLARLEADDPGLARTLVVVVADHGEELAEHGRISHEDWLADGVQHIPWIVAGAGVEAGRVVEGITENVDVVPTLAVLLNLDLPPAARFDGRAQTDAGGRVCADCQRHTATFAWEDYRALRAGHRLLREPLEGSLAARCRGARQLLTADRVGVTIDDGKRQRMAWHLEKHLGVAERSYRAKRYAAPATRSFDVPAAFWHLASDARVTCVDVGIETPRAAFAAGGWLWTGRGLTVLHEAANVPMAIDVGAPDGVFEVSAGVVPIEPQPWLFGFDRWRRKSFRDVSATSYVPLGKATGRAGRVQVDVPVAVGRDRHVVALRFTPPGSSAAGTPHDPALEERLRRLGYVE
jgi:arylsulfatase